MPLTHTYRTPAAVVTSSVSCGGDDIPMEPFVGHARRIFARSVCKRFLGRLQFVQIPYFSLPKRWCASSVASTLPQRARLPTRCSGCGVTLQCADANSLGYFKPPSSLQYESGVDFGVPEAVALVPVSCICQRCHRAKHYGHLVPVTLPYKEFQETLKSIIARLDVAMVAVLDVTDIHGSVLPELARAHGRVNDIVFAVNKCDVLPTSALKHLNRLDIWVRTELRRMGFPSGLQLHLISSKTGAGFKDMMASIKVSRTPNGMILYIDVIYQCDYCTDFHFCDDSMREKLALPQVLNVGDTSPPTFSVHARTFIGRNNGGMISCLHFVTVNHD